MTSNATADSASVRVPSLMCFPFLALSEPCEIGPWVLLPYQDALDERWETGGFRGSARDMIEVFRYGVNLDSLENPTLIARAGRGFTGEPPDNAERVALTAAVAYCALDRNIHKTPDRTWILGENLDYWEFPVSGDRELSLPIGRRHTVKYHNTWSPDNPIVGPSTLLSIPIAHVTIQEHAADMLYRALFADTDRSRRLRTAIMFFVESWRNTPSVFGIPDWAYDYGSIICAQQTALETLLSQPRNGRTSACNRIVDGVRKLIVKLPVSIADDTDESDYRAILCRESSLARKRKCGHAPYADEGFVTWSERFTAVRNATVHEGDPLTPLLDQVEPVQVLRDTVEEADLVLRDAIRLTAESARH